MRAGRFLEEKRIYRFFSVLLLSCIALFAGGTLWGVEEVGIRHFLAVFLTILFLVCLKAFSVKGRFLTFFFLLVCIFAIVVTVGIRGIEAFFSSYGNWLAGSGGWNEEWLFGYQLIQLIAVSILCYFLQFFLEKYGYLKLAAAAALVGTLIVCMYRESGISGTGVALICVYLTLTYVEWQQSRWDKMRSENSKQYMLWILPFFALYFLLLLFMPAPQKPYQWQWAKDAYSAVKEAFLIATQNLAGKGREDFDMAFSGFSEDGELRGDLAESSQELMTIRCNAKQLTNVYLAGTVYDTFHGRGWEKNDEQIYRDRYLDTMETLAAVRTFDKEYQNDYLRETSLTLYYRYLHTDYLFLPLKLSRMEDAGGDLVSLLNGQQFFEEQKGYGTEYEVRYFQMNANQEVFYRFLEDTEGWDEAVLLEIMKNYGTAANVHADAGELEEYHKRIQELYSKSPLLSDEMEAYLEELTKDAGTDLEKLVCIEEELSSRTYTRTPGNLPDYVRDESSFLDYFLLEKSEGYCTHFATAFVLLARAEGIPARYVQGFCVPMKGEREAVVTSGMAHAWPEVYLEGIGWIPFEPTPGYGQVRYTSWGVQRREGEGTTGSEISTEAQSSKDIQNSEEELQKEEEEEEREGTGRLLQAAKIFGSAAAAVLAVCLLMLVFERIAEGRRYRKMNNSQKLQREVFRNLQILAWLGVSRGDVETLQELQQRTKASLREEPFVFFEAYEAFLYGDRAVSSDILREIIEEREVLLELLRERRKWVYIYCKIKY